MSYDEEFWWDELDEFFTDFVIGSGLEKEEYLGKVFLVVSDKEDVENEDSSSLRIKNNSTFDNIKKFEPWIGSNEVKEWEKTYSEMSDSEKEGNLELLLYTNDWSYVCSLTITKEQMEEKLEDV